MNLTSPSKPNVYFLGAWLVLDLKRALPWPPSPPFAITYEALSSQQSSSSSLEISS